MTPSVEITDPKIQAKIRHMAEAIDHIIANQDEAVIYAALINIIAAFLINTDDDPIAAVDHLADELRLCIRPNIETR